MGERRWCRRTRRGQCGGARSKRHACDRAGGADRIGRGPVGSDGMSQSAALQRARFDGGEVWRGAVVSAGGDSPQPTRRPGRGRVPAVARTGGDQCARISGMHVGCALLPSWPGMQARSRAGMCSQSGAVRAYARSADAAGVICAGGPGAGGSQERRPGGVLLELGRSAPGDQRRGSTQDRAVFPHGGPEGELRA